MFEYRCCIKLKSTAVDAAALKLLRKHYPNTSLAALRGKIQAHDYVYTSDLLSRDGERLAANMLREFDRAGIETELFEESREAPLEHAALEPGGAAQHAPPVPGDLPAGAGGHRAGDGGDDQPGGRGPDRRRTGGGGSH